MRELKFDMARCYQLPHPQLKGYFNRQRLGSVAMAGSEEKAIVTTPLFGTPEQFLDALDEWAQYLRAHLDAWPQLLEFEMDMYSKVGPLSVMKPLRDRLDSIKEYYHAVEGTYTPVDPRAIDAVAAKWGRSHKFRLYTSEEALADMKKSTNSGSPYFTKRSLVIERGNLGELKRDGWRWVTNTPDGSFELVATLGWRGQEGGRSIEDVKQRVLWMFPMDLNLAEARLYSPLVHGCQKTGMVATWLGNDAVDARITQLFDTKNPEDQIIGTDFTKYDQHYNSVCADAASGVYDRLYSDSAEYEWWKKNVFPAKFHIPMCYDWGRMFIGYHGMASGSGGTNADETTTHSCFQEEAAITDGAILNQNSMCLGDDGILSYPGITVDHVLDTYMRHGQVMNVTKQHVSRDDAVFLRRWHHQNYRVQGICRGVYATTRALGKLKYMERFHEDWGKEAVIVRALSIIENCCYHPLREEFLEFCLKGDEYGLGTRIPGFFDNFDAKVADAVAKGQLGYQYTDTLAPKPAKSWWVYQALKSRER